MYPSYSDYWDIRQNKSVRIASPVGQAQFILTDYTHMIEPRPNEWLLLCRFADTIGIEHGDRELRELRHLAEHLKSRCFEGLYGYVDPMVAIEIEKEIVLHTAPGYSEGLGHDITPAVRLLKGYEQNGPVFTQAERNLILTHAYFMGGVRDTEQIAGRMAAHDFSSRDIAAACAGIEAVNLEWSGLERMEGIEVGTEKCPTFQFSFANCEDPMKGYPRFTFYPTLFPHGGEVLQSGVVIRPCPDAPGRWQSDLWKIDQTYTAPRYYMEAGSGHFELAEYVDIDNPHDLEMSVCKGCIIPRQPEGMSIVPQKSIRKKLRDAAREIGQRSSQKGSARDGEAR